VPTFRINHPPSVCVHVPVHTQYLCDEFITENVTSTSYYVVKFSLCLCTSMQHRTFCSQIIIEALTCDEPKDQNKESYLTLLPPQQDGRYLWAYRVLVHSHKKTNEDRKNEESNFNTPPHSMPCNFNQGSSYQN
jgi:hypothetical protein